MRRLAAVLAAAAFAVLGGCAGHYPPGSYPGGAYSGSYGAPYPQSYPQQQYPATQQGIVRCESQDGRSRHCPADVRGGVSLSRQLSRTACLQGRNWGYDAGGIWVNDGCRADFMVGGGAYPRSGYGQRTLRCESVDGREKHCAASLRGAGLQKQVSRTPCIQGRNWRWDASGIWVKDGCRADFAIW